MIKNGILLREDAHDINKITLEIDYNDLIMIDKNNITVDNDLMTFLYFLLNKKDKAFNEKIIYALSNIDFKDKIKPLAKLTTEEKENIVAFIKKNILKEDEEPNYLYVVADNELNKIKRIIKKYNYYFDVEDEDFNDEEKEKLLQNSFVIYFSWNK